MRVSQHVLSSVLIRVLKRGPRTGIFSNEFISTLFLEQLIRSWSHCMVIYRQKLTRSSKVDF